MAVTEVRVFGQGKDEGSPRPLVAERSNEVPEAHESQSAMDALGQVQAAMAQAQPTDLATRANEFGRLILEAFGSKRGGSADSEGPSDPQLNQPEPGETQEGPEEVSR